MTTSETLRAKVPEYAKDIRLNLSSLLNGSEPVLSMQQIATLALASAYATRELSVVQLFEDFAASHAVDKSHLSAVKTAVAMMSMNNVYYRSVHSISKDYTQLPAQLRMHALRKHGIAQEDFELLCVAVSAINGCGHCLKAHVLVLEEKGVRPNEIQYSLRLASVIQGLAQVMTIERLTSHK